ncbi:MAG: autotransporter-associated beta strand repeat-containing protein [Tepidisphaeraceae bacterium]
MKRRHSSRRVILDRALAATALGWFGASIAAAEVRAFPEAEGFGATVTGGRGGAVYHVTNLNDAGVGSFRDAVSQPNRIVVFDVGGWVELKSAVSVKSNITIAGQTAPGQGIGFKDYGVSFSNASNVIARHLRMRQGPYYDSIGQDATGGTAINGAIFDHISATWGRDENFSVTSSTNITIQNSIIGEGLLNHSMGGLLEWNNGLSVHHNLYISNNDRNPKSKGVMDFVNNVVFNWGSFVFVADSAGLSYGNVVGNTFIAGPASSDRHDPISRGNANYSMYFEGNYFDGTVNGVLDGGILTQADVDDTMTWMSSRFPYPQVTTDTALDAYNSVLNRVGPSISRDSVDARLINNVRNQTGGLISDPAQAGGWGTLSGGIAPIDTDQDGMPDTWETPRGLNPNDAADRNNINLFGYTRVEEYLNELGGAHTAKVLAGTTNWSTPTDWNDGSLPAYDDTAYIRGEAGTNGNAVINTAGPTAWDVRIGGDGGATGERLLVGAGGSLVVRNDITVGYKNTGNLQINGGDVIAAHVILGTYAHTGTLAVTINGVLRTTLVTTDGAGGSMTLDSGKLVATGPLTVSAPLTLNGGGGTIDTDGFDATVSSVVSGGRLIKTGAGNLNLTNANTFARADLVGGSLSITSDTNIGGAGSVIHFQGGLLRVLGTGLTTLNSHTVNWSTFNGGIDVADAANTFTIGSTMSGTGAFTKAGPGTLLLSAGSNGYTGGTTITGGVLSVSSDAQLGGTTGPLNLAGGTVRYATGGINFNIARPITLVGASGIEITNSLATATITNPITGAGSFTKLGAGKLVLAAANTYTGLTTLTAGVTQIANADALRYSTVIFNGGTLDLNGLAARVGGLSGTGNLDLKGTTLTIGEGNQDATFAGVISSSTGVGSVEKVGAGTINFTGANTYTGGTALTAGAIGITSDANIGGATSAITFTGGLLRINGTTLTGMGSHVVNWSTFNGGFDIDSAGNTFTVTQNISGSGSLTKKGAGALVLSGVNNYAGGTVLQGGVLQISSPANIGNTAAQVTFAGGILRPLVTSVPDLNFAMVNWSTFNGGFDVVAGATPFTVSQSMGGSGSLTKLGAGILALTAVNTYTGDTFLNAGTVRVSQADALRTTTLVPGGGALAVVTTNFVNLGGIKGAGTFNLSGFPINVGFNNLDTVYSGVMTSSSAQGGLTKVGTGTLTLTGASTHTRSITIQQGVISVSSLPSYAANGPLGAGTTAAALVLDGGTLQYNGTSSATSDRLFTLTKNGGTIECAGTGKLVLNGTGAIAMSGTGDRTLTMRGVNADCEFFFALGDPTTGKTTLHKDDGGRWIMSGAAGTLTYSGDTVIDSGILIINGNVRLPFGAGKGSLVINAGQFEMNGRDMSINGLYGNGNIQNRTSTKTLTLGNADANGDFSGVVSNTGGGGSTQLLNVTKVGAGVQVFSGFNTYGGVTTVQAGTLVMASHGAAGYSSILVSGGTLRVDPGSHEALPIFKTINIGGTPAALTGTIDIASGGMIASKAAGNTLASLLAWRNASGTGKGIVSSWLTSHAAYGLAIVDNADVGLNVFHGRDVTSDSLIVAPALLGDANLDGLVNFADLLKLASSYGSTGVTWSAADFNADGSTNFSDLLVLAGNYGQSEAAFESAWAMAQASVPESGAALLAPAALAGLRRLRR